MLISNIKLTLFLFLIAFGTYCNQEGNLTNGTVGDQQPPLAELQENEQYSPILGDEEPDPNLDLSQVSQQLGAQNIQGKGLRVPPCRYVCRKGYRCFRGRCVPYKCPSIPCKKGFQCVKGICIRIQPSVVVCPSNSAQPKKCTYRPTQKECPTVYYIRQPDPVACGIRADGTRVDFSQDCEACKDESIVYYFSKPCHKIPFICSKGEQCLDYYCGNARCSHPGDCPYDWQTCWQGKCIDSCSLKRCGGCKYGQCAYQQPNGNCFFNDNSKCQNGWVCIVSQCGDLCWNKPCPANQRCSPKTGICQPQIIIY